MIRKTKIDKKRRKLIFFNNWCCHPNAKHHSKQHRCVCVCECDWRFACHMQLSQARPPQLLQIHLFILIVLWLPPHHLPFGFCFWLSSSAICSSPPFERLDDWRFNCFDRVEPQSPVRYTTTRFFQWYCDSATSKLIILWTVAGVFVCLAGWRLQS